MASLPSMLPSGLLLVVLVLVLLSPPTTASRSLSSVNSTSSAPAELADGATCKLSTSYKWNPPFCKGGILACILNTSNSSTGFLQGKCDSKFSKKPYCTVGPFRFAVGVKKIPPYGPSSCETCTCKSYPEKKGRNKSSCDCDPLPSCYIDTATGKEVGNNCKYQIQSKCVISKPNAGKVIAGKKTHLGVCQAPQTPVCVSAGPTWGPFFYALGASGVPLPGNRCRSCLCRGQGVIEKCKKVPGCKTP